ncbi:glycoside hydrolase [Sodiomyces alkalinus F11]|uniref:Probable glucan endo-1,3-beta-glucosidase eglC n=1 Tax=Sodiomyces alkalinus (strain CBS 110278 / VKM F-3762 / F11) TaxID=1314773 RepID=A0A3N2Q222_SODAK|nr:glycoside hydrolase [Sodiomyces alkalinus F11]ROT40665.1 glycoside hydrolase [Sodiomyces alkalinus F11]
MHTLSTLAALAAAISTARAAFQGFNYGNVFTDGSPKTQADFEALFGAAANLDGTDGGFTSARLYTMVQAGTANDPISAIPAAINTGTSLLLGIWASAGADVFANELEALRRTIAQYGDQLDGLIAGISVGSEDLYRNSPTGIEAGENPGANPDTLVGYFERVRDAIQGTPFANYPIGHVDTWTAWDNSSNQAVIDASDFIGFNGFAYWEANQDNDVSNGKSLFDRALGRARNAVGNKPIWITEVGWPVSGATVGQAVPSAENAEIFWKDVGCPLFGETNIWWYTLQDSAPFASSPSFGIIGSDVTTQPLFDLTCDAPAPPPSSAAPTTGTQAPTETDGGAVPGPTSPEDDNGDDGHDGGDDDDDDDEPAPTVTESPHVPEPTGDGDHGDDGHGDDEGHDDDGHDDGGVMPPPSVPTDSPAPPEEPVPTQPGEGGNATTIVPPPVATGDEDEDGPPVEAGASSLTFSAACLAVMFAVAVF